MTEKHFAIIFVVLLAVAGLTAFFTMQPSDNLAIPGMATPTPTPDLSRLDTKSQQESNLQNTLRNQDGSINGQNNTNTQNLGAATKNNKYKTLPPMSIDTTKKYTAIISTSKGDMTVELDAADAPKTVNNFVFLAKEQFYDGVVFHRIIRDFMSQTGDPTGTGMGGPGYKFEDEPVTKEYTKGTLAMANSGKNTNGSQFFIMNEDYPLPPNYTIFGKVTEGMETVDAIASTPVTRSASGENSKPTEQVTINSIKIQEN